jgi:Flp pilus assembly protein TadD
VIYSPDGKQLASASEDSTVRLWDALSGKHLATLAGHTEPVTHVIYSPDGKRLASASLDKRVRLWDALSGKPVATLAGHTDMVTHVVYSPDGKRLASASWDHTVRLWDAHSGKHLAILAGHIHWVTHVIYSPDGKRLASASVDHTVRLWIAEETAAEWDARLQNVQEQQAYLAESEKNWFAAAFHLGQLLSRDPENAALWRRRGRAFAEQDRWSEAAANFAEAHRMQPSDSGHLYRQGLALFGGGDEAGYRAVSSTMFRQFSESKDADTANAIARLAVLRSNPPRQPVALTQRAVGIEPRSWAYRETLGAAHYRAGDYTEAVRGLTGAARQRKEGATVWMQLFLAMAHHRLGESDRAKRLLQQAVAQMEREAAKNPPLGWENRLSQKLLRQEAESLLRSLE